MATKPAVHGASPRATDSSRSRYSRYLLFAAGIFAICAAFFLLQFSTTGLCCGDFDGYYHIQWSHLLWEGLRSGHFPPAFTWLPLTTLNAHQYADQHFLFHLLLIPFTWMGDLPLAAKTATAVFGSLAVFSLYWLILRYKIRNPLLWLLALLGCSWVFYVRLNMPKAQSLSLLFMVIGIVLLLERKYLWLLPTAFLYVWAYNLFVLLAVLAFLWVVVLGWTERRLEWRPLLWTGLGIVAGFVISPYFPKDAGLFLQHLLAKSGGALPDTGSEWNAFTTWNFLKASFLACAAMIAGYIGFGYVLSQTRADRGRAQRPLLFLLFSSMLLLMAMRSVRFLEYWPPFAVLFAAFTLQAVEQNRSEARAKSSGDEGEWQEAPVPEPSERAPRNLKGSWLFELAPVAVLLVAICWHNFQLGRAAMSEYTTDPERYAAGAAWLRSHVPPGALIYDLNYSDFPKLFFYDTAHTYVSGLDPLYLQNKHPELAELNRRLSNREEPAPASAIRSDFAMAGAPGLTYLFVGSLPAPPSQAWLDYMRQSGGFDVVYEDSECMIFRIRN